MQEVALSGSAYKSARLCIKGILHFWAVYMYRRGNSIAKTLRCRYSMASYESLPAGVDYVSMCAAHTQWQHTLSGSMHTAMTTTLISHMPYLEKHQASEAQTVVTCRFLYQAWARGVAWAFHTL